MSSRWSDAVRHALPLRLGLWYAGLFTVGSVALLVVTYSLLSTTLVRRDHEVLEDMLARYRSEYQRAGLTGLNALIEADEGEGLHERMLVRLVGPAAGTGALDPSTELGCVRSVAARRPAGAARRLDFHRESGRWQRARSRHRAPG
jgi:hypothetical protein